MVIVCHGGGERAEQGRQSVLPASGDSFQAGRVVVEDVVRVGEKAAVRKGVTLVAETPGGIAGGLADFGPGYAEVVKGFGDPQLHQIAEHQVKLAPVVLRPPRAAVSAVLTGVASDIFGGSPHQPGSLWDRIAARLRFRACCQRNHKTWPPWNATAWFVYCTRYAGGRGNQGSRTAVAGSRPAAATVSRLMVSGRR